MPKISRMWKRFHGTWYRKPGNKEQGGDAMDTIQSNPSAQPL